jgi:hypothetical protein
MVTTQAKTERATHVTRPQGYGRAFLAGTAGACLVAMSFSAPAHAAPPEPCGINVAAPQVTAAVQSLPPYPGTSWAWSADPASVEGNFNPCATLSTALGFTTLDPDRSNDDTVVLDYKLPGACNACAPTSISRVRYQWQGDHVAMLDPAPPSS